MPEATGAGRDPGLREMAAGDLEAVARLEGELFGAEAWSRDPCDPVPTAQSAGS